MLESGKATDALCNYDGPQGKTELLTLLCRNAGARSWVGYRSTEYCTNKRQPERVFLLFNLFAGRRAVGVEKSTVPLAPEYIGYADAGLKECFVSARPNIELLQEGQFKYHVDFEHLHLAKKTRSCVSRPTIQQAMSLLTKSC